MNPPPPIGGVTISVKNLIESLGYYDPNLVCNSLCQDRLFRRYDLGHVHATNKYKRLYQILYLQMKCKKVIFTVHGVNLQNGFVNRLSIKASDGVVFLNDKIINYWSSRIEKPMVKLPTLFKEGYKHPKITRQCNDELTLLLYANRKAYKDGFEVYGVEFALASLSKSNKKFKVIVVDVSAEYKDVIQKYHGEIKIEYHPNAVDFNSLLQLSDIYLRPTSMDGSSLAVQEALMSGTRVIASNVVDRESEVVLYEFLDEDDFLKKIFSSEQTQSEFSLKSVSLYLDFIEKISIT